MTGSLQAAILTGLAAFFHISTFAQNAGDANVLSLTQSDNLRLEVLRQRTSPSLADSSAPASTPNATEVDTQDPTCLAAKVVSLVGADLIPTDTQREWVDALSGQEGCLTVGQLNGLLYRVSSWYLERGYITSQPIGFNINDQGDAVITVQQGRIGKLVASDHRLSTRGLMSDEHAVLNLRAIEQAAAQINRLGKRKVQFDVEPGELPGTSVIRLRPDGSLPTRDWSVQASVDNRDPQQLLSTLAWSGDDLWGRNENIYLSATQELNHQEILNRTQAAAISMPSGFSTYAASLYTSQRRVPLTDAGLVADTDRQALSLRWDRVFQRSRSFINSGSLELNHDRAKQRIDGVRIESASWSQAHLSAGFEFVYRTSTYGTALNLQLDKGLGGSRDRQMPQGDYTVSSLRATLMLPMAKRVTWVGVLRGQTSDDYLPGFRQFWIGGTQLVPGFRKVSHAGNSGALAEMQLNVSLPGLPDALQETNKFAHQLSLRHTQGWIAKDAQSPNAYLRSMSLHYDVQLGGASLGLSWAHPLRGQPVRREGDDWTVQLSYRY
jgi:hemolysin activation/secretion protein